jgi:hypothetical protein
MALQHQCITYSHLNAPGRDRITFFPEESNARIELDSKEAAQKRTRPLPVCKTKEPKCALFDYLIGVH